MTEAPGAIKNRAPPRARLHVWRHWCGENLQVRRVAQIYRIYRGPPAIPAELFGRVNQFFIVFGVRFNISFFLQSAQGLFIGIAHFKLLSSGKLPPETFLE
jgi:hypothetical protein